MILNAKIKTPNGETVAVPFLVRFAHTPAIKDKASGIPEKTRVCVATIYTVTDTSANEASEKFSSKMLGDKFVTPIAEGRSICHVSKGEDYCRAFARQNALEKALRAIINPEKYMNQSAHLLPSAGGCPYKFTAETFNNFISCLRKDHHQGLAAADAIRKKINMETIKVNNIKKQEKINKIIKKVGETLIASNPLAMNFIRELVAKL